MKTEEFIKRYGEAAYLRWLKQRRKWGKEHLEEVIASNHELNRKGGKYYEKNVEYQHSGLSGKKKRVRTKHGIAWRPYKNIIAPWSQIHHEWIPETAKYRGIALVEADQHMHGFINPIEILEGSITLFTEEEIARGELNA